MASSTSPRRSLPRSQRTAFALLAVGVLLAGVVGNLLDGFVGGLFQGAGVALILIGTILLSTLIRRTSRRTKKGVDQTGHDGLWLPSQDGDR